MCGFIAAFTAAGRAPPSSAIRVGLNQMARRGPDAEGLWQDEGVLLGHRRLAILDLDPRSSQPLHSGCGRYIAVFNGEIYNFAALKQSLSARGVVFRTTSDTEVLLEMFKAEGEAMLSKLHGMFAFVIWDRDARRAFAARDPYGIKPLYLAHVTDGVMLASQVKALIATGLVSRRPDLKGQAGFWMLGSIPEPYTWYADVKAVPSGGCMWIEAGRASPAKQWLDIGDAWRRAARQPPGADPKEVVDQARSALLDSVRRHLVSDVPVGVFLSGGIDSGALVALMVECGASRVQSVTLNFDDFSGRHADEGPVAAQVAAHYGVRHHMRRITRQEFQADAPRILQAMDQPSIDGVNTWYASKAAAELGLKVVVSGVGGDELFLGYESFKSLPRLQRQWSGASTIPGALTVGRMLGAIQAQRTGNSRWRHAAIWARSMAGVWWLRRSIATAEDLPHLMGAERASDALAQFHAESWVEEMTGPLANEPTMALAQIESMGYLRNQLLRDSDWASMDHSVELRTPLVDAHLLDRLTPYLASFAEFPGKELLAQAPKRPLPFAVTHRKKTGFDIPVQKWLGSRGKQATQGPALSGWADWMRQIVDAY